MLKTKNNKPLDVIEFEWEQAREILLPLNKELVNIIDEISPGIEYKLYKARYPYGVKIFDKLEAYLPLKNGKTILFTDESLPANLAKNLYYDKEISNPVGMVLQKNLEFYLTVGSRAMPFNVAEPGSIFGLARILDNIENSDNAFQNRSFFMWELTSGVRSLFMMPKINENTKHIRLKKMYGITEDKPTSYQNHHAIFKDLACQNNLDWYSEVLFFSNNWFENLTDSAWAKLYAFFLKNNRSSYAYWRNYLSWQITFDTIEQRKNIRGISAYALHTAQHLYSISARALPGFRPATDDMSAPISFIQKAYLNGYELEYWPNILEISNFSDNSCYYSLNYPTLAQSDPNSVKSKSIITLLGEVRNIIAKYQQGIKENSLAKSTSLHTASISNNFSFFHDLPTYHDIQSNIKIAEEDSRFAYDKHFDKFSIYSPFLRGCIKISPNAKG